KGTDDDRHLGREESEAFIADPSPIVEEKLDGTNVGIHFTASGRMVLQCRGHETTEGMHPQHGLFKPWTAVKRPVLETLLGNWSTSTNCFVTESRKVHGLDSSELSLQSTSHALLVQTKGGSGC